MCGGAGGWWWLWFSGAARVWPDFPALFLTSFSSHPTCKTLSQGPLQNGLCTCCAFHWEYFSYLPRKCLCILYYLDPLWKFPFCTSRLNSLPQQSWSVPSWEAPREIGKMIQRKASVSTLPTAWFHIPALASCDFGQAT